ASRMPADPASSLPRRWGVGTPVGHRRTVVAMSKTWKIALAVVVVLVAVVAGGLWWFLRDDAPPEVSLESAVEQVSPTTVADDDASETATIDGTWTVDTTTGEFDFETATGTFAGFRIQEELSSIGSTTAVGRTGD